jgi:hypothetical protein
MWSFRLRCFALLGAGALGLHELRYLIGYGGDAGRALAQQGHGYLDAITALIALALVTALAVLLAGLVRGAAATRRPRRWSTRWLAASGALLTVFTLQELCEGALASGHPEGLGGVFGHGGWVAVLLALAIGALVALLLRGADAVLERFASTSRRRPPLRAPRIALPRAPLFVAPRVTAALAGPGAGRAPPLLGC